jgi:signal peptidase II
MLLHESFTVVEGFVNITLVRNPGAAFGFLTHAPPMLRFVFFIAITVLALGLILYYVVKSEEGEPRLILALALILGGALGNLIDRVRFGEVVDFIDVYFKTYHWPSFNIAYSAISLGAFFMLLVMLNRGKENKVEGQA